MNGKATGKYSENIKSIAAGHELARAHPLIAPLPDFRLEFTGLAAELEADAWLRMEGAPPPNVYRHSGAIAEITLRVWPNIRRREPAQCWAYVFARAQLHIVLNHLEPGRDDLPWHMAGWYLAEDIVSASGVGVRPAQFLPLPTGLPREGEDALADYLRLNAAPHDLLSLSLGGSGQRFWSFVRPCAIPDALRRQRRASLARGVRAAATQAVDVAGGARESLGRDRLRNSTVRLAREWVISEFPLLAAIAAAFTLIEDERVCQSMGVAVAAICDQAREIYVNPRVSFTPAQARFVMAHELLHAGLRHSARRQGRDAWLWNVACDFVINDWLLEMDVGEAPDHLGYLHDMQLRGLSAEEVYDRIVTDLRWMRKLRKKAKTLNGDCPDILDGQHPPGWWRGGGVDLDAFYRRALSEGLEIQMGRGRGYLPAGLVEEIRALSQPPIPWDVQLGQWLDQFFPPLEKRRSYARAHRRQAATPDIARPAWVAPDEQRAARVFAAIVDTSGSMSRVDLGKAVGAIASYAMSREVGFVRLIQCDAAPYDAGYVEPVSLLESVKVTGRGGTILMPAIELLQAAPDFPADGPVLIITDGACDPLIVRRPHAYLLAEGGRLPFAAKGPIFRFS